MIEKGKCNIGLYLSQSNPKSFFGVYSLFELIKFYVNEIKKLYQPRYSRW